MQCFVGKWPYQSQSLIFRKLMDSSVWEEMLQRVKAAKSYQFGLYIVLPHASLHVIVEHYITLHV